MPAAPVVISANDSNIKCDGEVIPGVQSIEYKIVRKRDNVHPIGINERVGIDLGEFYASGILRVRSAYPSFEEMMANKKSFQLVVELKNEENQVGTVSFDGCFLESNSFSMESDGTAISEYAFTGTKIRTKLGDVETDYR